MKDRANRSSPTGESGSFYGQRRVSEKFGVGRPAESSTPAYLEQVRMLYAGARTAVLVNIANASILTYLLWDVIERSSLTTWLTAMVGLQLGRHVLARYYRAAQRQTQGPGVVGGHRKATRWDRLYLAGVAATGSLWGLAGYSLFPHHAPEHQLILIFILGGTVAGGTALLAAVRSAFPLFALPALIPLGTKFFLEGDAHSTAMGALSVIFLAALLNVARLIHKTIDSSITLRFGNKELVADLQTKTGDLSQINQLLRREIDQRTDAQEQLQNQLFFLQELMDAIPSPVFHKDTQGVYRGCNKAFETLVGRARSAIIGRTAFEVFPRELAESLTGKDRELFDRGSHQAFELELPAADGTLRRMLAHRALYHNPVGKVLGVIGVLSDVPDRRKI